jgi:hypothetical protein
VVLFPRATPSFHAVSSFGKKRKCVSKKRSNKQEKKKEQVGSVRFGGNRSHRASRALTLHAKLPRAVIPLAEHTLCHDSLAPFFPSSPHHIAFPLALFFPNAFFPSSRPSRDRPPFPIGKSKNKKERKVIKKKKKPKK